MEEAKYLAAVIGAGPAGLFASRYLSNHGVRVALFNRDVKPGGLAEYGIYPDKIKMKEGLRKQFQEILSSESVDYFGNIKVSSGGNLMLSDLTSAGFQAIVVATGAQGTKWLRLPGEQLPGVYHAKDLVFHYNQLPPFSERRFLIGSKVILVGAGNVMMDLAHYLVRAKRVDEVRVVMRRGPAEIKFTKKELENVAANIDFPALDQEIDRVSNSMLAAGQNIEAYRQAFHDGLLKALPKESPTRIYFEFLASPVRILGDWTMGISSLKVEDNTLTLVDGKVKARGTGITRQIDGDTVIFAIGDTVDKDFSLPIFGDAYCVNEKPSYPVNGISYEAYDIDAASPVKSVFLAGWARQASTGLVGVARKDGETAAQAVLQYLGTLPVGAGNDHHFQQFSAWLNRNFPAVVRKADLARLQAAEKEEMQLRGLEDFKFSTNETMFQKMGFNGAAQDERQGESLTAVME